MCAKAVSVICSSPQVKGPGARRDVEASIQETLLDQFQDLVTSRAVAAGAVSKEGAPTSSAHKAAEELRPILAAFTTGAAQPLDPGTHKRARCVARIAGMCLKACNQFFWGGCRVCEVAQPDALLFLDAQLVPGCGGRPPPSENALGTVPPKKVSCEVCWPSAKLNLLQWNHVQGAAHARRVWPGRAAS